jgi:hypothetical protein
MLTMLFFTRVPLVTLNKHALMRFNQTPRRVCTKFVPFAAFGGAGLMDGSFLLLLGADRNKREIRYNNQPLYGLGEPVNANNMHSKC